MNRRRWKLDEVIASPPVAVAEVSQAVILPSVGPASRTRDTGRNSLAFRLSNPPERRL